MKRGTTPTLSVLIEQLNTDLVSSIEFLFKTDKNEAAATIALKSYPGADVAMSDGVFLLRFTDSETRRFPEGTCFMDTRVTLRDGSVPATNLVVLNVTPTLFEAVIPDD